MTVAERVRALGWKQVEIINSDLGSSAGIASAQREGFERVLSSGSTGRGRHRRQPGGIAAIPDGQRLVSACWRCVRFLERSSLTSNRYTI